MRCYCHAIESSVLGRSVPVRFIVPVGDNLPCLVLLHGYNGDHNQWFEKSNISQIAEMYHLSVILPGCGNGYYEDTVEDIPSFIGYELMIYAKKELPISGSRDRTFIAGVSMGGFGAVLVGAKFNHIFGKVASLSGAFIIHDVAIGNSGVLGNANVEYFRSVFGDFQSLEGSSRDPIAEIIRVSKSEGIPAICMLCGKEDALYQGNLEAVHSLRAHSISVVWYGGTGNHRWPFWNDMLPHVIRWLVENYLPEGIQ